MNRSALTSNLQKIEAFLQADARFLLTPEDLTAFLTRTEEIHERAQAPAELLYVAIAGGTGVGKSTLINALARREISRASDRRPFTDRAVAYRHRDAERGLSDLAHLMREPDAVHESDAARDLVLLDLPDFDSKEEINRGTVREILPNMDCVIWVTSPEKYADAIFYELVRQTAKDQENFTFVLNKADQLIVNGQPDPLARIKEVIGDLTLRLKHESGISQPRTFSLSAMHQFQALSNELFLTEEFERFREFLMVKRDAKEIASIKTTNLVQESRQLVKDLTARCRPFMGFEVYDHGSSVSRQERPRSAGRVAERIVEEEKHLTEELYHQLAREDASVGPVAQALRFLVRSRSKLSGQSLEGLFNKTAEGVAKDKTADLFKATARIDSEILLALRGTAAAKRLREPEVMLKEAMGQAFRMFAAQVEKKKRSLAGRFSAWRRLWQRCVLCVPAALLVLKLAGWDRIESWLESPSFLGALKLVLALLTSLFGPEGLVGLTALLICEILLILYLAARRNTRIRRMARQLALQGIGFSEAATDSAARSLEAERLETIRTVGKGMEDLKSLAVLFGLQRSLPGAD